MVDGVAERIKTSVVLLIGSNCFITCKIKIVNVLYYQRFLTFYTILLTINTRIYLLMVKLLIKLLISYWLFLTLSHSRYTLHATAH